MDIIKTNRDTNIKFIRLNWDKPDIVSYKDLVSGYRLTAEEALVYAEEMIKLAKEILNESS